MGRAPTAAQHRHQPLSAWCRHIPSQLVHHHLPPPTKSLSLSRPAGTRPRSVLLGLGIVITRSPGGGASYYSHLHSVERTHLALRTGPRAQARCLGWQAHPQPARVEWLVLAKMRQHLQCKQMVRLCTCHMYDDRRTVSVCNKPVLVRPTRFPATQEVHAYSIQHIARRTTQIKREALSAAGPLVYEGQSQPCAPYSPHHTMQDRRATSKPSSLDRSRSRSAQMVSCPPATLMQGKRRQRCRVLQARGAITLSDTGCRERPHALTPLPHATYA